MPKSLTSPLTWHQYFGAILDVLAKKSKDPHTQVGALITNDLHQIIATGYNGFPRGLKDINYPWKKEGTPIEIKYTYVVHAEMNAIISSRTDIRNLILYTSLFPCANCAKIIVQSQLQKVYFMHNFYKDTEDYQAAYKMLTEAGIDLQQIPAITVTIKTNN